MKFVLEVNLDEGAVTADPTTELGRILRYWAGNLKHYEPADGVNEVIYDSGYTAVGSWRYSE